MKVEELIEKSNWIENFYRKKIIGNEILLTTEHGSWIALDKTEYDELVQKNINNDKLFHDLEDRGIILTKYNLNNVIEAWEKRYAHIQDGASLHIIVPTIRCNHCCVYCHSEAESLLHSSNSFDMNEEVMLQTLDFIFRSPSNSITIEFQGGEALLNKKIIKLVIEHSKELNKKYKKKYKIALVSNLTEMDEDIFAYLVENKNHIGISTSLDGPKELHDKNRYYLKEGRSSYDDVTYWIRRLQKAGFNVGLLMVTTRYSLTYWKEIIDEYVKWGKTNIQIKPLDYLGFAVKQWDTIGYSLDEFNSFWCKCVEYMLELQSKGVSIVERYFSLALNKIVKNSDANYMDWASPCGMIRGQIVYNYNGDIYPCDESRVYEDMVLGNVQDSSYISILGSDKAKKLLETTINDIYYCDSCAYKPFCGICSVLTYEYDKNFKIKPNKTDRCKRMKYVLDYTFNKVLNNRKQINNIILGQMISSKLNRIKGCN